jgi:hypothetical protein
LLTINPRCAIAVSLRLGIISGLSTSAQILGAHRTRA